MTQSVMVRVMSVSMSSRPNTGGGLLPGAIVRGLGTALLWGLILSSTLGIAYFIVPMGDGIMNAMLLVSNGLAMAVGGVTAARNAQGHGWIHGGLTGLAYASALWAAQIMGFAPSESLAPAAVLVAGLMGLVAGGLGGMLGMAVAD